MKYIVDTANEYIGKLDGERKERVQKLREIILENMDIGFKEGISYGMISYFVPHSIYPKGYHVNSAEPLPFMSLASQKNHIAIYHHEMYINEDLKNWFTEEYEKRNPKKLDMSKSCIRFKDKDDIPFELIADLIKKSKIKDYINLNESKINNK